jgi:hypothetical protein
MVKNCWLWMMISVMIYKEGKRIIFLLTATHTLFFPSFHTSQQKAKYEWKMFANDAEEAQYRNRKRIELEAQNEQERLAFIEV